MASSFEMTPMSWVRSTKMRLLREQRVDLVDDGHDFVEELLQPGDEGRRQVARLAADAGVAGGEARAGELLAQVVDLFALGEGVEEDGHRAHIHGEAADAEQVRGDARQLAADHADGLAARRAASQPMSFSTASA